MIDTRLRCYVQGFFDLLARPLIAIKMSPTQITLLAAGFGFAASALTLGGTFAFRLAAVGAGAVSAVLDILDGTVARKTGRKSPLGAFLDLILDRIVEAVFILVFSFVFPHTIWPAMFFLTLVIVNFSAFLAAGSLFPNTGKKSIHYESGLVERTETFILFGLMLIFPQTAAWFLWIFNTLMALTAVMRLTRIIRYAKKNGLDGKQSQ